jgi:DNA-binding CsgD family transcriptional regulator
VLKTARAARAAPRSPQPARASDLLLDGLALVITDGYAEGRPTLAKAVHAFRGDDISPAEGLRWLSLAPRVAAFLWDDESWDVLSARFLQLARDAGALSVLPLALNTRAGVEIYAGRFAIVASLLDEMAAANAATGAVLAPYVGLARATFQGREDEAAQLIETATNEVMSRGESQGLTFIQFATAVLYNGLGRYEEALATTRHAGDASHPSWWRNWGLVELIEAAARSGEAELAADALGRLSQTTAVSGTDWALGVEARSRALLTEGDAAEPLYRQAIERLDRTRIRVELARAHLLYGEWLRRERRRVEAREQLRHAHHSFTEFGMEAFAERARVELEATGEHARKRTVETRDDLTPQEAQISRLAAEGATNQEIAARLFISPSTVDYHLRKVFRKLGIKSRRHLKEHLIQPSADTNPAARES